MCCHAVGIETKNQLGAHVRWLREWDSNNSKIAVFSFKDNFYRLYNVLSGVIDECLIMYKHLDSPQPIFHCFFQILNSFDSNDVVMLQGKPEQHAQHVQLLTQLYSRSFCRVDLRNRSTQRNPYWVLR
jgi:hypothetical protein